MSVIFDPRYDDFDSVDEPECICNPDTPDDPTPDCYHHGTEAKS